MLPAAPADIVGMVADGRADLGLASIVDCIRSPEPLALVPVGMIGCDGPTLTVRVFSEVPFEQIDVLHADTDSHTSVVLAQLLLRKLYNRKVRIVAFDAAERGESERWPPTVLLIGDKVVTDHPPEGRYPHQLDLGDAWKQMTDLPFVYAMWMCRADEAGSDRVRTAAAVLDRQRRHNQTRIDWLIAKRAASAGWPIGTARTYLRELLRYEVGPRERQAATVFLREAAAAGLIPSREPIWADASVAV